MPQVEHEENKAQGFELLFFEVEARLVAVDPQARGRAWVWSRDRWRFVPALVGKAFADGLQLDPTVVKEMFADADLDALKTKLGDL